jgi:hypothetical protein
LAPKRADVKSRLLPRLIRSPARLLAGQLLLGVLLAGCTASHYRKSADQETYGIVQQMEQQVFGHTNAFTIDTRYSSRKPIDIPASEIISDRTVSNRLVLNLDQALDIAVKNSREYQTQKEKLYLSALSLTGARYEFSPQFFANSSARVAGSPNDTQIGSVASQVGVNQLLRTGGKLGLALGNDLLRYFTGKPDLVARNSAINIISVNLSQPLLRGFGINDPLVEALTQSERDVVYAVRSYSLYQQQFAVDTVNAYFDLATQKDICATTTETTPIALTPPSTWRRAPSIESVAAAWTMPGTPN